MVSPYTLAITIIVVFAFVEVYLGELFISIIEQRAVNGKLHTVIYLIMVICMMIMVVFTMILCGVHVVGDPNINSYMR